MFKCGAPLVEKKTEPNKHSPLLTDIVGFDPLCMVVSLTVLEPSTRERFPHPYKECFVSLLNRCGISQSTPLGTQRPCWHTARCLTLIPFVTT